MKYTMARLRTMAHVILENVAIFDVEMVRFLRGRDKNN